MIGMATGGSSGTRRVTQAVRTMGVQIDPNPAIDAPGLGPGDLGRFRNRPALGHQQDRLDTPVRANPSGLLQGVRKTTFIISIETTR